MNDGWRVHLVDDFMSHTTMLVVHRPTANGSEVLTGFTEDGHPIFEHVPPGVVSPNNLPHLPIGALSALREAIQPGPSKQEMARLEDALTVERQRVDKILDKWFVDG